MFVKAIKIATRAMFPLFRFEQVNQTRFKVLVIGAGYFINRHGYFATVAHIFDNSNPQTSFRFYGFLPDNVHNPPLTVTEIARDDDHDIYIGRIEIESPNYFYFSDKTPEVGKSICISGYPLAQIQKNAQGGLELGGVRRYFQPSFVLDYAVIPSDNGFGRIRTHDGFLVRDVGLFGMSGGPVFSVNGRVFGMQGSVTQPRVSTGGGGRSISVENALIIRSSRISELLKNNDIRCNLLGNF